jgi:hypothetical protein
MGPKLMVKFDLIYHYPWLNISDKFIATQFHLYGFLLKYLLLKNGYRIKFYIILV